MAVYTPTAWVNNVAPALSATNLNKLTDELESQATAQGITHSLPTWADGVAPALTDADALNEMERVTFQVALSLGLSSYTRTVWETGWTPARNAARFNSLEQQVARNRVAIDGAGTGITPAPPVGPFTSLTGSPEFLRRTDSLTTEKLSLVVPPYPGVDSGPGAPYGIGNMVWPPQFSTGTWTLRDCISENVHANPPRSPDGKSESGFWVGQRTNASRLVARSAAWMGMFTGGACNGSVIEDVLIEDPLGVGNVGIYVEHMTVDTTFRRIKIDHTNGDGNAFNVEWWYGDPPGPANYYGNMYPQFGGKAGSYGLVLEDFEIIVNRNVWGIYLDAGTFGCTIRRGIIRCPEGGGKGIRHPGNLMDPSRPNSIDLASITFEGITTPIQQHWDPIG